jgi:methionyl-tRNA synthetase
MEPDMSGAETKREKILVTSALPYANGPIHFGHIAGAYLPADIFVRYKKMTGADIIYICGSDDHGIAITVSAEAAGRTPEEHVRINHDLIAGIFDRFNIQFTNFSGTSHKIHYPISQDFFTCLNEKGLIEKKEAEQLYCTKCNRFLADRYIIGTCPQCQFAEAWGNECPGCGTMLEASELLNPHCKICGEKPELRKTTHWYLKLGDRAEWLEKWIAEKEQGIGGIKWKPLVTTEVRGYLKRGLQSRAITRDLDWGVPVPLAEADGKVLYVWFDAPIGYISSTLEYFTALGAPERWKDYWQNQDCKLYHFIGKDNIPFHAIIFPIMLQGMDQNYKLPDFVSSNAFLNLEGRQFSKSAGWYIDVLEFLDSYPADSIRYYLCADMPENSDSEFKWDRYQTAHNSELTNILGNLVNRTLKFIETKMDGRVPALGESVNANIEYGITGSFEHAPRLTAEYLDKFEFRNALSTVMFLAREGNQFFDTCKPWKTVTENRPAADTAIRICLCLIKTLAVISSPFLPDTAQRIWKMLGLEGAVSDVPWSDAGNDIFTDGAKLPTPEILFQRIESKQIAEEKKKLGAGKAAQPKKKTQDQIPGIKKAAGIEDFSKLDLRIGRVLEAEPVQGSMKMLRLKVDIGIEQRQIVAGIAQSYKPDQLLNKLIVVAANLEPKTIMGLESRGMLLAGGAGDKIVVLTLDGDLAPGSRVS